MINHCTVIRQTLESAITNLEDIRSSFVKNPAKDFTRNRSIPFSDVLHFLTSLGAQGLDKEMMHFYSYSPESMPTSSAMIQARNKLDNNALPYLFKSFTAELPKGALFHGYQLLAVDGSKFALPENNLEPSYHVKNPNSENGHNSMHLNGLYHLQSGIFEDVYFQSVHEANEHLALQAMLERRQSPDEFILVADRGYESYNTFAHIAHAGGKYVIRGKSGKAGILSGLDLPETEQFDQEVALTLCKKHTKKVKENPKQYKRIRSNSTFDFFTEECMEYPLKLRVVKIKVSETLTEILYTNLSKQEITAEELKDIYRMRWGIETAFLYLKYALGAMVVHSKKADFVMQELYAKVIMFNFCQSIAMHVKVEQKKSWKYKKKLNTKMAINTCMTFWRSPEEIAPKDLEKLLLKHLVPIREGRKSPRKPATKATASLNHKIA